MQQKAVKCYIIPLPRFSHTYSVTSSHCLDLAAHTDLFALKNAKSLWRSDFLAYLLKQEWEIREPNEGNDGNAGNQGENEGNQDGNAGNQGGNDENQGGNARNQGGNAGNQGGNDRNQGGNAGNTGNQGENAGHRVWE